MKYLPAFAKLLLFFFLTIVLFSCAEQKVKPKIDYTLEDENVPLQESWNSEIYFSENGEVKAILYSDHIRMFQEPKEKLLTGLSIRFFNEKGIVTSTLTSKRGRIDDVTENMFAMDSVVAFNDSSQTKLETEELMWRKKDSKIVTDKFARITTPDEIIEGYGFVSDQSLKNYVIYDITFQTTLKKNK
ncbi:MAG: LPS export ABC transporter periplasmic protein LptC [Melioribacteraceae bacterium]|nr:LPS export ABC transporter periplasmic protein LptC [Melioribacteraceae bacterium]